MDVFPGGEGRGEEFPEDDASCLVEEEQVGFVLRVVVAEIKSQCGDLSKNAKKKDEEDVSNKGRCVVFWSGFA